MTARPRFSVGSSRSSRGSGSSDLFESSDSRSPDPHVKRALAAMADMRFLKADHQRAKFRQAQPLRHLAPQHAALGFGSAHFALTGDDKDKSQAVGMGA